MATQQRNAETKKRIVFIAGELSPFVELDYLSIVLNELLIASVENDYEVRCIIPKWSFINERRYRLHEVIRLSNLNVRIENTEYGLEIKVASLPRVRLQVYFIGNQELFSVDPHSIYHNEDGVFSEKNGVRNIFFCKGVLQILRKFGWPPDLIFCSHWISSLLPFYIKRVYGKEAIFQKAKVICSVGASEFKEKLGKDFLKFMAFDDRVKNEDVELMKALKFNTFQEMAIRYSDAVLLADKNISKSLMTFIDEQVKKEIIPFKSERDRMEYIKLFEILI